MGYIKLKKEVVKRKIEWTNLAQLSIEQKQNQKRKKIKASQPVNQTNKQNQRPANYIR
jgi:hypothetical protein